MIPRRSLLDRARNGHGGNRACLARMALLRTPTLLIIPSAIDPPARGADRAARVQMQRPTGRTIWTWAAWSAGLAQVVGGRDDQPHSSRSRSAPAGGICSVDQCRMSSQCAIVQNRRSESAGCPGCASESGAVRSVCEKAVRDQQVYCSAGVDDQAVAVPLPRSR